MAEARVLVVDDDPHIRDVLKVALDRAGFEVDLARDGREGLVAVESRAPDLAIFDIGMPEMDGKRAQPLGSRAVVFGARRLRARSVTKWRVFGSCADGSWAASWLCFRLQSRQRS